MGRKMKKYEIRFVYSNDYSISLPNMDTDSIIYHLSQRYRLVASKLHEMKIVKSSNTTKPDAVDMRVIESITTPQYLESLKNPKNFLHCIYGLKESPTDMAQAIKSSIMSMVMETLKATQLSYMQGGLTINMGGGFHHARKDKCGGFSIYNDYFAAAKWLWQKNPNMKILYIDLDAHFGDGVLAEMGADKRFFHYDIYNSFTSQYSSSSNARVQIHGLANHTDDKFYLKVLMHSLENFIDAINPDFIFYNAGSDSLIGDELGQLSLSERGLKLRDQYVFECLKKYNIASIMTLSGGYTKESINAVISSIYSIATLNGFADSFS